MLENITLYNVISFIIIMILAYYLYKNYIQEGFAEKHHHHHAHHAHHQMGLGITKKEPVFPNEIWGASRDTSVWKTNLPCVGNHCGTWAKLPGPMKNITQTKFDVWGLNPTSNEKGNIYRCPKPCSGNWQQVPGTMEQISAGENAIWGTSSDNKIFYCDNTYNNPCKGDWKQTNGALSVVSAL